MTWINQMTKILAVLTLLFSLTFCSDSNPTVGSEGADLQGPELFKFNSDSLPTFDFTVSYVDVNPTLYSSSSIFIGNQFSDLGDVHLSAIIRFFNPGSQLIPMDSVLSILEVKLELSHYGDATGDTLLTQTINLHQLNQTTAFNSIKMKDDVTTNPTPIGSFELTGVPRDRGEYIINNPEFGMNLLQNSHRGTDTAAFRINNKGILFSSDQVINRSSVFYGEFFSFNQSEFYIPTIMVKYRGQRNGKIDTLLTEFQLYEISQLAKFVEKGDWTSTNSVNVVSFSGKRPHIEFLQPEIFRKKVSIFNGEFTLNADSLNSKNFRQNFLRITESDSGKTGFGTFSSTANFNAGKYNFSAFSLLQKYSAPTATISGLFILPSSEYYGNLSLKVWINPIDAAIKPKLTYIYSER